MVLNGELFLSTFMSGIFDVDMREAEKPNSFILPVNIKGFGVDSRDVSRRFPDCLMMCVGMSNSSRLVSYHTSGILLRITFYAKLTPQKVDAERH